MSEQEKLRRKILSTFAITHAEAKKALVTMGYKYAERKGSGVAFTKLGCDTIYYHIPHGSGDKNLDKEAVKDIRAAIEEFENGK